MARPKKATRKTSFVTLRTKDRAKGRKVLYLDYYVNGKRSYEFLKLYLVAETDNASKELNKKTMDLASAIRDQRELEVIKNGEIQIKAKSEMLLSDWMKTFQDIKSQTGQSENRAKAVYTVRKHLEEYAPKNTKLSEITPDFCRGFISFLANRENKKTTKTHAKISALSASSYFTIFGTALNEAVSRGLIDANPIKKLSKSDKRPIKAPDTQRCYLTIGEIKRLINTECKNEQVKFAFLFSCFTGLRISDIKKLTWKDVTNVNGNKYIGFRMKKTLNPLVIKLSKQALRWMPKQDGEKVFNLPIDSSINRNIKKWAKQAGIEKNVTFHTSRHTFATMELTLGADLYTVSKLLGHKSIRVTQIYAEVINDKKDKAIDLTDGIF